MQHRGIATLAAGFLLCLPAAAWAQEAEPQAEVGIGTPETDQRDPSAQDETSSDETAIGESEAVVCRGTVAATVVDLDGAPVDGARLSVAGEQLTGFGTVAALCGEVAASLLAVPDGYAPAGPTTMNVQVRRTTTTVVTFTVDPVEVLGTQFTQPSQDPAAPSPTEDIAHGTEAAPELAATGPEDAPTLLLLALSSALLGTILVAGTPPPARRRAPGR